MPNRVFLNWDTPLLPQIVDRILPDHGDGPLDLGETLFITPTRQAGRRLREELARRWRERGGTALLSVRVRPPSVLFQPEEGTAVANGFDLSAAWAGVLSARAPDSLPHLLPGRSEGVSPRQALELGQRLQKLREELADADCDLSSVPDKIPLLSEQERWRDMAELERQLRETLHAAGLADPCDAKRARARSFSPPEGVTRIVLAGVPDPSALALLALKRLEPGLRIECWIHAPESEADSFDAWGRPAAVWRERAVGPEEDLDGSLELLSDPEALCARVAGLLREGPPSPHLAFGLLDEALAPRLELELQQVNRSLYNPRPVSLGDLEPVRLLRLLREAGARRDSAGLRALWRHPDLLRALARRVDSRPERLLQAWDAFAAEHVPGGAEDVDATLTDPLLLPAWKQLRGWLGAESAAERLTLLKDIYDGVRVVQETPSDRLRERAARAAADLLQEAARRENEGRPPDPDTVLRLLRDLSVDPLRVEGDVTAEGWLELSYHPAPSLMLLGLQEGVVPGTQVADTFLPDGLRAELGLRSDRDWLARDAFLFHTLCACREPGAVRIFCMKRDEQGGPRLPSRLLFQCGDALLLARARLLFGETPPPPRRPHAEPGVMLDVSRAHAKPLERISVTAVKLYLACPTRFYLSQVLHMRKLDDLSREPDGGAFGSLLHKVLEVCLPDTRFDLPEVLARMDAELNERMASLYGPNPGLAIEVMRHSAHTRLHAAARLQWEEAEAGWVIVHREQKCRRDIDGLTLSGVIDRVDHHPRLGWRIVDYKTTDSSPTPKEAHLGPRKSAHEALWVEDENGKPKQWTDLQLPLYRWLAEEQPWFPAGEPLQVAYFQLPKAVNDSGLVFWKQEEALAESARNALSHVSAQIRNGIWGPPAEQVRYDDFEALFHHGEAGLMLP